MIEIANAPINSFASSEMQANFVPSSEQSITVSLADLRQIITEAVQKAIEPLQDEVTQLRSIVARQDEMIAALKADEKLDHDDIRDLFDAIASMEQSHIQPLQKDRGEILRALIAANGGKMLAKDARVKMHLIKPRFSELLVTLKDEIEVRPYHLDKRQLVLIIK